MAVLGHGKSLSLRSHKSVPISEWGFGFGMSFVFRNEVGHCVPPLYALRIYIHQKTLNDNKKTQITITFCIITFSDKAYFAYKTIYISDYTNVVYFFYCLQVYFRFLSAYLWWLGDIGLSDSIFLDLDDWVTTVCVTTSRQLNSIWRQRLPVTIFKLQKNIIM